jgi:nickel/cobalt transporter (NiCoT) family protein
MSGFDINKAGYYIVGLFVVTWAVALFVWRFGKIETRWETRAAENRARVLAAEAGD